MFRPGLEAGGDEDVEEERDRRDRCVDRQAERPEKAETPTSTRLIGANVASQPNLR
jgi:hypothetical protein